MPIHPHDRNLSSIYQTPGILKLGQVVLLISLNWWGKPKLRGIKIGQGLTVVNSRIVSLTWAFWLKISFPPSRQWLCTSFSSLKMFVWVRCKILTANSPDRAFRLAGGNELLFSFCKEKKRKRKEKNNLKAFPCCNILHGYVCIQEGRGREFLTMKPLSRAGTSRKEKKMPVMSLKTVILSGCWVYHCRAKPNCSLE